MTVFYWPAQNPGHYTIQVIGLSTKAALQDLIDGYERLAPFAIYTLQRKNRPLYMLIQGDYPTVEEAVLPGTISLPPYKNPKTSGYVSLKKYRGLSKQRLKPHRINHEES